MTDWITHELGSVTIDQAEPRMPQEPQLDDYPDDDEDDIPEDPYGDFSDEPAFRILPAVLKE